VVVTGDGVTPSHTGRGYVLRRLVRRLLTTLWRGDPSRTLSDLPDEPIHFTLDHFRQSGDVRSVLRDEETRFRKLVRRGRPLVARRLERGPLTDEDYHYLHDTHGLPRDLVDDLAFSASFCGTIVDS
jgi:alanyl-tRNA synthetase